MLADFLLHKLSTQWLNLLAGALDLAVYKQHEVITLCGLFSM